MIKAVKFAFLGVLSLVAVAGMIVLNAAFPIIVLSAVLTFATGYDFIEVLVYVSALVAIIPLTLLTASIVVGNQQFKRK